MAHPAVVPVSAGPPPGPLPALTLDPITTVDGPPYYDTIAQEANLPPMVKKGLVVA
ncbi:MAG: hypothetical protein M3083_02665 [Actinomycetota bacterium]|nr:hypothetical protein [Actinomycetota bacterium]